MLFRGPIGGGAASGKMGAVVAAHNTGGQYLRARTTPTNPATTFQQEIRNAVATLATRWTTVLSDTERENWKNQGENGSYRNRLGDAIQISGIAAYLRANAASVRAGFAPIDDAPAIFADTSLTLPVPTLTAPSTLSLAFNTGDDWANNVGGHLFVYASRPQNPAINFFKGPYRLLGTVDGAGTPPTSPAAFTYDPVLFGVLTAFQVVFFRFAAVDGLGSISPSLTARTVAL